MREATVHTVYITVQYMSGEVGATISDSTGSFKRIEVFKFRLRAIKINQIKFESFACFSPIRNILSGLIVLHLILASKLSELEHRVEKKLKNLILKRG